MNTLIGGAGRSHADGVFDRWVRSREGGSVERQVRTNSVLTSVTTTVASRGKVLRIESLKRGNTVTCKAQIEQNEESSEVTVDPAGHIVTR